MAVDSAVLYPWGAKESLMYEAMKGHSVIYVFRDAPLLTLENELDGETLTVKSEKGRGKRTLFTFISKLIRSGEKSVL